MKRLVRWFSRVARQSFETGMFVRCARLDAYYDSKAREHIEVMRRVKQMKALVINANDA